MFSRSGVSISGSDFEKFSPPTMFRVGGAIDPIDKVNHHLTISLQLNHPVDNAEYIVTGLEYSFMKMLFLRTGYKSNKKEENLTIGAGLVIPIGSIKIRADYGYANFEHLLRKPGITQCQNIYHV